MRLTEEQRNKISQKEAVKPEALKRDPSVNYTEGWFFVTLNTRDDVPVLSTCVGSLNKPDGEEDAPHCNYSQLGMKVKEIWATIPKFHEFVVVDKFEAMPEHIHGLLYLKKGNTKHLGKIINGFMIGCTHAYWDTLGIDWRKNHPSDGKKLSTSSCAVAQQHHGDRNHTFSTRGPALFVHGFNDVEPLTIEEVEIKRRYIQDQARKRLIQGERHTCFIKYRHQRSRGWTTERALNAIVTHPYYSQNTDKCEKAIANLRERLNVGLDHIGNKNLVMASWKLPLICHRANQYQFEIQKEAVMNAARKGAIIVSAFISPQEREIKKLLMAELLPFVEIMDNGFAERYKPNGLNFYAVAENRLFQITCWKYAYQKDVKISREMCIVMNELAKVICGIDDNWWK